MAVFEPAHGSAPDIAGKNQVNPTSMLRCGVMLLHYLGEHDAADRVERAVDSVLSEGKATTRDMGGAATTTQFTDAVLQKLK